MSSITYGLCITCGEIQNFIHIDNNVKRKSGELTKFLTGFRLYRDDEYYLERPGAICGRCKSSSIMICPTKKFQLILLHHHLDKDDIWHYEVIPEYMRNPRIAKEIMLEEL